MSTVKMSVDSGKDLKIEESKVVAPLRYCYIVVRKNKEGDDDTEFDYSLGKADKQFEDRPMISKCDRKLAAQSFLTDDAALTFAIAWMEDSLKTAGYDLRVLAARHYFGDTKAGLLEELNKIFGRYEQGDLKCSVIAIKLPVV